MIIIEPKVKLEDSLNGQEIIKKDTLMDLANHAIMTLIELEGEE